MLASEYEISLILLLDELLAGNAALWAFVGSRCTLVNVSANGAYILGNSSFLSLFLNEIGCRNTAEWANLGSSVALVNITAN
jgi:hypothetical protein